MTVALVLATSLPVHAAEQSTYTILYAFVPQTVEIAQGDSLVLHNLDRDIHGLKARDVDEEGRAIFNTPRAGVRPLDTGRVSGIEALAPGSYAFFCEFHTAFPLMTGTLVIRTPSERR